MPKKKKLPAGIKAEATARAELVAKATYQRKRTITEQVPADVTRAKAGAWLSLISPITEWAGLKGDALRFKRDLLRVQQEETLLKVALGVRERLAGHRVSQQVPPKILVPALEKASLERPDDDVMIDRWANLLASAATEVKVQPRFVGILEELAGRQAELLELVAFNRYKNFHFPATILADSCIEYAAHNIRSDFEDSVEEVLTSRRDLEKFCRLLEIVFSRPGVYLMSLFVSDNRRGLWEGYDVTAETGRHDRGDFSILESLGLVREVMLQHTTRSEELKGHAFEVSLNYYHLTDLGVQFCGVCSRARVSELEKINAGSAKKGLKRRLPFDVAVGPDGRL